MSIYPCIFLTLTNLCVGASVRSGSVNVTTTTSPTDHDVCTKEDILIAQLSVSELKNKITQQKLDICQLGAQVTKLQKDVENIPRLGVNTIKEMLAEISSLTRAQSQLDYELTLQRSTIQLQQAAIEQIQRQTAKTTVQDCPDGYIRNERTCYKFYDTKLSWLDSLTHCKVFGSHLVVINTTSELSFLQTKLEELRALSTNEDQLAEIYKHMRMTKNQTRVAYLLVETNTLYHITKHSTAHGVPWIKDDKNPEKDIYSMTIFWIAATDAVVEGDWIWVESGSPASLTWKPGQPNDYQGQDCGALTGDSGYKTEDKSCRAIYHHICEIELQ